MNDRILSLLRLTGLDSRVHMEIAGADTAEPIDWEAVEKRLLPERERAMAYLKGIVDSVRANDGTKA